MIKALNLYAGIGGNRKLWPENVEVTAIENNSEIAGIYKDFFPNDTIIITDAHKYLEKNFEKFEFIWSSPPCQRNSRMRKNVVVPRGQGKPLYPNLKLYEEIIFLRHYYKGPWIVENVIPYYEPLIKPDSRIGRHLFWSNFIIPHAPHNKSNKIAKKGSTEKAKSKVKGMSIKDYKLSPALTKRKDQILNNCIEPSLGLHVFECAFRRAQDVITNHGVKALPTSGGNGSD
jgi:DNA (cytosine-5)-methyltransferase 1